MKLVINNKFWQTTRPELAAFTTAAHNVTRQSILIHSMGNQCQSLILELSRKKKIWNSWDTMSFPNVNVIMLQTLMLKYQTSSSATISILWLLIDSIVSEISPVSSVQAHHSAFDTTVPISREEQVPYQRWQSVQESHWIGCEFTLSVCYRREYAMWLS